MFRLFASQSNPMELVVVIGIVALVVFLVKRTQSVPKPMDPAPAMPKRCRASQNHHPEASGPPINY
jgi:hypothetical protein